MLKARMGDRVRVQYLGLLADGKPATQSRGREVLDFTVGSQSVAPGISQAVVGMAKGEEKRVTLPPAEAFGPVNPRLIKQVPRHRLPEAVELYVGKQLLATGQRSGRKRRVRVVELSPDTALIDGNHRLAGQTLKVELLLVSIRPKRDTL